MRATLPTARPAHAAAHLIEPYSDTMGSRFLFLCGSDPADPLVAREWRDIRPHAFHLSVRLDCPSKICWQRMYGAGGVFFLRHRGEE